MSAQLEHGVEIDGYHVVAADAVAKLAGVNLQTCVKVMTALYAINRVQPDIDLDMLVSPFRTPSAPADDIRYNNTEDFVDAVVSILKRDEHSALANRLQVQRRFNNPT